MSTSAAPGGAPSTLDAATLARIGDARLRARTVVEGALAGLHRSPHHGASVEFAEHKEYAPGDEVRHIDWKAYGKFDKYYVKRFEEETELRAWLVVDCSASMGFRGHHHAVSKLDYAGQLAAALGYLLVEQQDHAGLVAWADRLVEYLPPRGRAAHLGVLLDAIGRLAPPSARATTDLAGAVAYVSDLARRRSLVCLFSDLLDGEPERAVELLRGLRARKHDVVLFHVLDGDELRLPEEAFAGPTIFCGVEDDRELLADPRLARDAYLAELGRFLDGVRRACAEGDVDYCLVDTARPPSQVLVDFLQSRQRARVRAR